MILRCQYFSSIESESITTSYYNLFLSNLDLLETNQLSKKALYLYLDTSETLLEGPVFGNIVFSATLEFALKNLFELLWCQCRANEYPLKLN
jgi:hypothetical protein